MIVLGAGTLGIDEIADDDGTSVTVLNSDFKSSIDDAHFTSSVTVDAMNDVFVNASSGNVTFDGDLNVDSFYGDIGLTADGHALTVDGTTRLYASPVDFQPVSPTDSEDRQGGSVKSSRSTMERSPPTTSTSTSTPRARTMSAAATVTAATEPAAIST